VCHRGYHHDISNIQHHRYFDISAIKPRLLAPKYNVISIGYDLARKPLTSLKIDHLYERILGFLLFWIDFLNPFGSIEKNMLFYVFKAENKTISR